MRIVKLETEAQGGSKVKANASKHKAMNYGRLKQEKDHLMTEIDALLKEAEKVDSE